MTTIEEKKPYQPDLELCTDSPCFRFTDDGDAVPEDSTLVVKCSNCPWVKKEGK